MGARARIAALAALGALVALAAPADAVAKGELRADGRWIKDPQGRVVIVHGLQVAHKTAPYHPPPESFDSEDAERIAAWGFDAVRLAWFWIGLEPERGVFDRDHLDEIVREGQMLADHGVYTLLEAHQDLYGPAIGGDGFPEWATITDGVPRLPPSPFEPQQPVAARAFDNLYANTDGIADEFAGSWKLLARAFRNNPRMLGYDLINEPYPGSHYPTCMQPAGCPAHDRLMLQPFEERLARAIREVDRDTIAFFEPNIYFDVGVMSWLDRPGPGVGPAGFANHAYCLSNLFVAEPDHNSEAPTYPTCDYEDAHLMDNAERTSTAMGVPSLLGEFGDTQDLTDIRRMVALADGRMQGWIYWAYKDWVDAPGGPGDGDLFDDADDDSTLRSAKLAVLTEPYPQATAGVPRSYGYDPATNTFAFEYEADPSIRAPTVVFVPPIHYPDGYRVEASGARVVSGPGASRLQLANERPGLVRVVVGPPAQ